MWYLWWSSRKKEANWRPKIKPSCTWNIFWIFLSIYFFISRLNQWRREGSWDLPLHLITCFAFYTTWRVPIRSFLGQWCRDQLNWKFLWLHWIRLQYPHQDIFFLSQQQFGEVGTAVFTSTQSGSSGTSRQSVGFAPDWVILSCSVQSPAYLAASVPYASRLFPTHMLLCGVLIKKSNSCFSLCRKYRFLRTGSLWAMPWGSYGFQWLPNILVKGKDPAGVVTGHQQTLLSQCCSLVAGFYGALHCFPLDTLGSVLAR